MTYRDIIWPLYFILNMFPLCHGQDFPELHFDHITVKEGLSSNVVNCITEDQQGFIWIGTINGLNRYDGYRFKHYYHSNTDTNSLVNNNVQRLYCDTKGRLWMSTDDGVSCFLPAENRFINYSTKLKTPYTLKINGSTGIYEDDKGTVWLCNQEADIYQVLEDLTLQEVHLDLPDFSFYNLSPKGYENIYRDNNGNEWAFKANRIYLLNNFTKQADKIFYFPELLKYQVLRILQDTRGNYFITTWKNGVFRLLPERNMLQPITSLPDHVFTDVAEWTYMQENWIVCADANYGLYLVRPADYSSRKYSFIPGDPSAIHGSQFNSLYIDKRGNLWIASNMGINKITKEQNLYNIVPITESGTVNYQHTKSGNVYSFFEFENSIWISKRFVSTLEYDTTFQLKKHYFSLYPLSSTHSTANGFAYYFYKDKDDLYISTDSGLVCIDLLKGKSTLYFPPQTLTYSNLRTIVSLSEEELLIRSFDKGLFVFNIREKRFTKTFTNNDTCNTCLPLRINYLMKTRKNEIFVTADKTGRSLLRFEPETGLFKTVKAENEDKFQLLASNLFGLDEDEKGYLWITGTAGLFIYDPATNTVLEQKNDNEQIGGLSRICFDNDGNAWASGSSGIWCYLKTRKKWIGFTSEDGLPGSAFDGIIAKRKNGDIISGLEGAIAIFHPDQLTQQQKGYPIVVTEAIVNKRTVSFPLITGIPKKLIISPGSNYFSVDFAMLNYLNPVSSHYYYKLDPLMKEFQVNDNGHINFNGLASGQYTLYVRGGDKAGNIYPQEDTLTIEVEPTWFQTVVFKAALLFLLAGGTLLFIRRRITTIRQKALFQQKIVETEMQSLRAQMNPHFIFNSLNSIENFIMQNEKRLASDYLNKFARLIRMILDSSRSEVVPLSKDMESLQLYIELEQLRFAGKFSYQSYVDPPLLNGDYKIPSLLIQPYVENAIIHGMAHSEKTNLQLFVSVTLEGDTIKYIIRDNGVGRKQAAEYNLRNKPGHQSVGLMITQDRILHFNQKHQANGLVLIKDLFDEHQEPSGTQVEVTIKYR